MDQSCSATDFLLVQKISLLVLVLRPLPSDCRKHDAGRPHRAPPSLSDLMKQPLTKDNDIAKLCGRCRGKSCEYKHKKDECGFESPADGATAYFRHRGLWEDTLPLLRGHRGEFYRYGGRCLIASRIRNWRPMFLSSCAVWIERRRSDPMSAA